MLVNIKHGKITLMTKLTRILTNDLFYLTVLCVYTMKRGFDRPQMGALIKRSKAEQMVGLAV